MSGFPSKKSFGNLQKAGVCGVAWMAWVLIVHSQESAPNHYQSQHYTGDGSMVIYEDHYKFKGQNLSMRLLPGWTAFYETGSGAIVRYENQQEAGCFIEIYQSALPSMPEDEKKAKEMYFGEIARIFPPLLIHSGRLSEDVMVSNSFPYICFLNTASNAPPVQMSTFFCSPPYLYRIDLKVRERFLRHLRAGYDMLIPSIRIEKEEGFAGTRTNQSVDISDLTPVNAPSAPVKSLESVATNQVSVVP